MKLLVLGATGATGRLVVEQALAQGHSVRALVRSPGKLGDLADPALEVVSGQATEPGDVAAAMRGVDAVITTLGAPRGSVMTDAIRAVILGAEVSGVKRLVVMSTFAVVRDRLSRPAKLITGLAMGAAIKDKTASEDLLRASDLDWTVLHAVRLVDGPSTGGAKVLPAATVLGMKDSISRSDVAALLITEAESSTSGRRAVSIAR